MRPTALPPTTNGLSSSYGHFQTSVLTGITLLLKQVVLFCVVQLFVVRIQLMYFASAEPPNPLMKVLSSTL